MDEKTLNSLCALLAWQQIQIITLLRVVEHPDQKKTIQNQFFELSRMGLESLAPSIAERFRDQIREGNVIQDLHSLGMDWLWTGESPSAPPET